LEKYIRYLLISRKGGGINMFMAALKKEIEKYNLKFEISSKVLLIKTAAVKNSVILNLLIPWIYES
jgi:hypothetical protein